MIFEIITRGIDLMSPVIPKDWDERNVIHLEDDSFTVIFKEGNVSLTQESDSNAETVLKLTNKKLCDYIDGTIDLMWAWRELAEPSPTDKSILQKGSGAKMTTLINLFSELYESNQEFKKNLDDFKSNLKTE